MTNCIQIDRWNALYLKNMTIKTRYLFFLLTVFIASIGFAQKGVTTVGMQYKPIIPNTIIGTYYQDFSDSSGRFSSSIQQKVGHSFGMVIRHGITNVISFETGLEFTQRNFGLNFEVEDSGYAAKGKVGIVGYEIPFKALIFIRLGKQFYMNTALGASFNYFPSEVKVTIPIRANQYFSQEAARLNRIQGALLANIGFEYRTKKSGYFYLGSSFNLPFASLYTFAMSYEYQNGKILTIDNVRGSYLTLDLRYYFNEKPETKTNTK